MTTKEYAEMYGVSIRRVQILIKDKRIKATINNIGLYDIPGDEQYPPDKRQGFCSRQMYGIRQRERIK